MSKTALHQRTTHVLIVTSKTDSHPILRYVFTFRTIDRLEERGVERSSARRSFLKGRDCRRQSDEHWKRFKDNTGNTSVRRDGAHMGISERIDTILK